MRQNEHGCRKRSLTGGKYALLFKKSKKGIKKGRLWNFNGWVEIKNTNGYHVWST